jgi:hypothetical protein
MDGLMAMQRQQSNATAMEGLMAMAMNDSATDGLSMNRPMA